MSIGKQMPEGIPARLAYVEWRRLRAEFNEGNCSLHCDCSQCTKRRKLTAMLELPYTGAPAFIRFKQEYE